MLKINQEIEKLQKYSKLNPLYSILPYINKKADKK